MVLKIRRNKIKPVPVVEETVEADVRCVEPAVGCDEPVVVPVGFVEPVVVPVG
jgi:hypothetical protein